MWTHLITCLIGVWLMAAPAVLGYAGIADHHDRIVGPLLASVACIAIWEVTRPLRWINVALGAWLLVAPWLLGFPADATVNSMVAGAAAVALSLRRGKLTHSFDGGWRSLFASSRTRAAA